MTHFKKHDETVTPCESLTQLRHTFIEDNLYCDPFIHRQASEGKVTVGATILMVTPFCNT